MTKRALIHMAAAAAILSLDSAAVPAADAPVAAADAYFGDSHLSDFYVWRMPLAAPGRMLRQEAIGEGFYADNAALARRILYSSTDGRWGRGVVPASGLLYLPRGTAPAGGWPLVVWGHGTFGIADICAPSWRKPTPRDGALIDGWLKAGFAVVAPDYQGLGTRGVHTYSQREGEGFSVLDAARAALAAYPQQISNRVILTGQSQGSGAVLNATAVAAAYAPDVHLLGTIATAVVWRESADPAPVDMRSSDWLRYLVMQMMGGGMKPGTPPPATLWSARATPLLKAAATQCSRDLVPVLQRSGLTPANAFTRPAEQVVRMVNPMPVAQQNLGLPILIATGLADSLIPPDAQYRTVRRMCGYGNHISWRRYDGVGHSATSNVAMKDGIPFARALLAGRPVEDDCDALSAPGPVQQPDPAIPFNI